MRFRRSVHFPIVVVASLLVLGAFVPLGAAAQPYSFTHLAGSLGGPGYRDGTGAAASFDEPFGVAVDGAGNVYVADSRNHAIRKVTPSGTVTTLAGKGGVHGSADGTGTAATFYFPESVAVDSGGTVYVADRSNHKIRKVTPGGVVTTYAGSGSAGNLDGTGAAAQFSQPYGVAVDGAGNVYVADTSNHRIRKIAPGAVVTTLAGSAQGSADGAGAAAQFWAPSAVAVDGAGNVYVADTSNHKIRKVTPGGVVTTLAGTGSPGAANGAGSAASFNYPCGIAVEATGSLLVADRASSLIRRVTQGGVVTTAAGALDLGSADGTGTAASFFYPRGVACDASGGAFVADTSNHRIRKLSAAAVVTTLAGSGSIGEADGAAMAASFFGPRSLVVMADGAVVVADTNNCKIRKIAPGGSVSTLAGSAGCGSSDGAGLAASFYVPSGVARDGAGNVYVADTYNHKIRKIGPTGNVSTVAGTGTSGSADGTETAASFSYPRGIASDAVGTLHVADTGNNKIRKVTAGGVVTTLAGSGAKGGLDGPGGAATFDQPYGGAVDGAGIVHVADTYGHKVRRVAPDGTVTTEAGSGAVGFADGAGAQATFYYPSGIAVDGSGVLFVTDGDNNALRRISGGVVSTVGGSGARGHQDGTGGMATFASPDGIAVDGAGVLYVADTDNNAIRLGRTTGSATCTPGDGALCLLGGRFRVTAEYGDYSGGRGTGKAVPLTTDTGTFWFFDAANVEAVVKMVSFCGSGSNNVAVYAGGLTDLDVTLHVADTRSGTAKDYRNPLGTGFTLIRDGPYGCPAAPAGGEPALASAFSSPGPDGIVESTSWTAGGPGVEAACAPDAATLCLMGGRFRVTASYRDYGGGTGSGKAVPITTDTGTFWFFSAANVETVVKMVSFCGGGSNNVAIYAGGLTDLEVALTVTDLQTGLVKSYTNTLGSPFRLVRDGPFVCP